MFGLVSINGYHSYLNGYFDVSDYQMSVLLWIMVTINRN